MLTQAAESAPYATRKLLVLGAGAFAVEALDLIRDTGRFEVAGFVESWEHARAGESIEEVPILWVDDIASLSETHVAVAALGTTHRKAFIETVRGIGFAFATITHPTCQVSATALLGEGSVLNRGAIVAAHTTISPHVLINRGCLIGHNVKIGSYSTISPGANIAGGASIGECTYIGMSAVVLNGTRIGAHSVVGAGAVVTRDVPDHVQVMGIPARVTKEDIRGL